MKKFVKSTDPRKAELLIALKSLSGGTKVTQVYETTEGFEGKCFKKKADGRKFDYLGVFTLNKPQTNA